MSAEEGIRIVARDVLARVTETQWGTTPALLDLGNAMPGHEDVTLDTPFSRKDMLDLLPDGMSDEFLELVGDGIGDDGPAYAFWSYENGARVIGEHPLVILANASGLWRDPAALADAIVATRWEIGPSRLLAVLGAATPQSVPFLAYMGADVLDGSLLSMISTQGVAFTGVVASLSNGNPGDGNADALAGMVRRTRELIRSGRLREVVEGTASFSVKVRQGLHHCDRHLQREFEYSWPVSKREFNATSDLSLWRIDIRRFLERLKNGYVPPQRKALLLLPCSASKPYSRSRTHRTIVETLRRTGKRGHLHEVIVTSPVGIVPRELETLHPASTYDIAVTGEWTGAERELIIENLSALVRKGNYERVLVHLPKGMEFVAESLDDPVVTCRDHPLTPASLGALEKAVKETLADAPGVSKGRSMLEDLTALATHQFGEAGKTLTVGAVAKTVHRNPALFIDGKQVCALSPERGCLVLTGEGAKRMLETGAFRVEIDDFRPKGDVFAVGVLDATDDIRVGDEVLVVHKGELRAVGSAEMTPLEMRETDTGTAVRLRHSVR